MPSMRGANLAQLANPSAAPEINKQVKYFEIFIFCSYHLPLIVHGNFNGDGATTQDGVLSRVNCVALVLHMSYHLYCYLPM